MTKLSRILKDYRESGAMNALVNIHAAIDDQTFLTKSGDLVVLLGVKGADYECLDATQLDQITRRFETILKTFDEHFRIYQYIDKREGASIPHSVYENPVVREAVQSRIAYLEKRPDKLYSVDVYFAIVYEGWAQRGNLQTKLSEFLRRPLTRIREILSTANKITVLEEELNRASEALTHKVASFAIQLSDIVPVEVLNKQRAYRFFRRLLNYAPYKADAVQLKYDRYVDYQLCDSALECYRDHLRLDDFYVAVLTLKEPPGQTFAHMLRGLQEIACPYVIASEWKRESDQKVRQLIQSKRRHFHNSKSSLMNYLPSGGQITPKDTLIDDSAVAQVDDLGFCLRELGVNGRSFGRFSMTVILYNLDRSKLRRR